jgi:hypothetical protein
MRNYANAYEKWLIEVDIACREQSKFPWNAICHDTRIPRAAYLAGKTPESFVEGYLKEHKPYVGYTF